MKMLRWGLLLLVCLLMPLTGSAQLVHDYSKAKNAFRSAPEVRWFFDNAYGYALFPVVGKAALIFGGAYGEGQVYRNGQVTGTVNLIHGSVGFQWGGQAFSEIIFFQNQWAYDKFTRGQFEFDAKASAVAQAHAATSGKTGTSTAGPKTGTQAQTTYKSGMASFVPA